MKNVKIEKNGDELIVRVDLTKNFGDSKSGKSQVIASSGGNVEVSTGVKMGINVFRAK